MQQLLFEYRLGRRYWEDVFRSFVANADGLKHYFVSRSKSKMTLYMQSISLFVKNAHTPADANLSNTHIIGTLILLKLN